jgi:hypothetical protein
LLLRPKKNFPALESRQHFLWSEAQPYNALNTPLPLKRAKLTYSYGTATMPSLLCAAYIYVCNMQYILSLTVSQPFIEQMLALVFFIRTPLLAEGKAPNSRGFYRGSY